MNRNLPSSLQEKLGAFAKKLKELLRKDYSLDDLKNLGTLSQSLKEKIKEQLTRSHSLSDLKGKNLGDGVTTSLAASLRQFELKQLPQILQTFAIAHRNALLVVLVMVLALLLNSFVITPYGQRLQNLMDMRPTQWSQLQSLIKLSKSNAASSQSLSAPTTVSMLDEMEMQKVQAVFTSRGVKLSVLRMTADNPPRLELQANDVMFSVLLDTLEDLRTTWHLYPEQLNVVATSNVGVVNVSGALVQSSMNGSGARVGGLNNIGSSIGTNTGGTP